MKLSVVIPIYNEVRTLRELVRRVAAVQISKEIILVDDGSTDGTREVLRQLQKDNGKGLLSESNSPCELRVAFHDRNRGKGAAVRTGCHAASGEIILIQDADLEYDPRDFHALIEPIERGEADAVLGSRFIFQRPRFFVSGGMPFFSHYVGNRIIIWLTNWLYGFRATDYEGCYKAFRRQLIVSTPVVADGFEFDNELVCKLLRRRARITEVPIHYTPRVYEEGEKIRWYDGVRMVWTILKWRMMPLPAPSPQPDAVRLASPRLMQRGNKWETTMAVGASQPGRGDRG